jgi:hypothetical protein
MPDGTRKRRKSPIAAKRRWYAAHRAKRFARRFWMSSLDDSSTDELMNLSAEFHATEREMAVVCAISQAEFGTGWNGFVDAYRDPLVLA